MERLAAFDLSSITKLHNQFTYKLKRGQYPQSSLKDLPKVLAEKAFILSNCNYILKDYLKTDVRFLIQDVRQQLPNGNFDLILCRNLIFTYFQQDLQSKLLEQIVEKLKPNVFFVLGVDESLKSSGGLLAPYLVKQPIYQKIKF